MVKLSSIQVLLLAFFFAGLCLAVPQKLFAFEGMSEIEQLLFDTINRNRVDASQEFDSEAPGQGLKPLLEDERLFDSAAAHAAELAKTMVLSRLSGDGSGVEGRMLEQKYCAEVWGEGLGFLLFQRYLPEEDAVAALYNAMIAEDQGMGASGFLNPDLEDMGLKVLTGVTSVLGKIFNYYLAVADLGLDSVKSLDKLMLTGVNTVRQELDLIPFTIDPGLYLEAGQALSSFIAQYKGQESERTTEPDFVKTNTRVWVTTDIKPDSKIVQVLLDKLFRSEVGLRDDMQVASSMSLDRAGVAVAVALPWEIDSDTTYYINAVTLIAESHEEDNLSEISGVLYLDKDRDGFYSFGEGLSSTAVYVYGEYFTKVFYSGEMGEFFVNLPKGQYLVDFLGQQQVVNVDTWGDILFLKAVDTGSGQ